MIQRLDLLKTEKALREIDRVSREERLALYVPYTKQKEFHTLGATKRERLLMAGNQNGKTYCGGAEVAFHLTGLYPDWWQGRRWNRPTRGWVAGVTSESTRDNPQRILLGTTAQITESGPGQGLIPKKCLVREKMTTARGVGDLFDTVLVKHFASNKDYERGVSDGWSEMKLKSYERGREKWQGETLDWLWYDEEPPQDIYAEGMARISASAGMVFVTFTPLQGRSDVVSRYLDEPSPDRAVVTMTIDDAEHIPVEERKKIVAGYLPHEREARARGVPLFGSGRVFEATEDSIRCRAFQIPEHWALLWGIDPGVDHPFAAVLTAWDRDTGTFYVTHCVRMSDALPLQHAAAMKPCLNNHGLLAPVAWPQDAWQRKEFGGELMPLMQIYRRHGMKMLSHHATFEDGSNSTEAGILGLREAMKILKFKVFEDCTEWFDEYRLYHRVDGQIVKKKDDLMSATRVAWMARRHARAVLFDARPSAQKVKIAAGVDLGSHFGID